MRAIKACFIVMLFFCIPGVVYCQSWIGLTEKERPTFHESRQAVYKFWEGVKTERKPGYKQFKRWEWFAQNRLDRDGYFDPSLNWRGWLEKERCFAAGSGGASNWTALGPFKVPKLINQNNTAAGVGRLNCIAFDPRDSNIIWVGAPSGGLWMSEDGGKTWTTRTDDLPTIGVSDIVIHPHDADIMYIASGDRDNGDTFSVGVLKSTDRGQTWKMTGLNPLVGEQALVGRIVMHPHDPQTILAAASTGVYKTVDGGTNWTEKTDGYFIDIEVNPKNPAIWYAARSGVGIYRSPDGGEMWLQLNGGLPSRGTHQLSRIAIAVSESSPHIIYALYVRSGDSGLLGVFRSSNGGDTWTLQADSPELLGNAVVGESEWRLGSYALVLAVSPTDSDTVYVGSVNLWKSTDGGVNWRCIANQVGEAGSPRVHWDHHDFAYLPGSSSTIFSCHDGGLHRSDDEGKTWIDLSDGLTITQIYRMGLSAQDADQVIIGNQDLGSFMLDGEWLTFFGGDGMECFIDPTNSSTIYFSYQWANLYRSYDGGKTVTHISNGMQDKNVWVAPFVMDPIDPATLYMATTRVYRSSNRGSTWSSLGAELSGSPLSVLEVAPSNPLCIYACDGSRLFKTLDGGENWDELPNRDLPPVVTDIAIHPWNPEQLWATVGGYGSWNSGKNRNYNRAAEKVFVSSDGGGDWQDITGILPNIPANCVVVDPHSFGVYVGTDLGVFYSASGMGEWERFDNGLPNVVVTEMEVHGDTGRIAASTYGRGVWISPLASKPVPLDLYPPRYFSGVKRENRSLLQREYINILSWGANPRNGSNGVALYRLYEDRGGFLVHLADLDAGAFAYRHRGVGMQVRRYRLAAVDSTGKESPSLHLKVK